MESLEQLICLTGKMIDLELGKTIINGDLNSAKEMLSLLIKNIRNDLLLLKMAEQQNDWEKIKSITHKIHGGSVYCGTPRLQEISARLEKYLSTHQTHYRTELLHLFILEIEKLGQIEIDKI